MKKSAFKHLRAGAMLAEVAFATVAALLMSVAIFSVLQEVRKAVVGIYNEAFLMTVYRDLQLDLERTVPFALNRTTDGYAFAPQPIIPTTTSLTLVNSASAASNFILRFLPSTNPSLVEGGTFRYSLDAGVSDEMMLQLGSRGLAESAKFHFAGWIDATDVPPSGYRPFTISHRVLYDLLRMSVTLHKGEMVPAYVKGAWAPRCTDWRWIAASRAGSNIPRPEEGIFFPVATHRSAIDTNPANTFDLFGVGPGSGSIGWLSWDGATNTDALKSNLEAPSSQAYNDPFDATNHQLSLGNWIQCVPGHHTGAQPELNDMVGQEVMVVVWDNSQGQGSNTFVQASAFAKVRIEAANLPEVTARFVSWVDDQGNPLTTASPAPAPTPSPSPSPSALPSPGPSPSLSPSPTPSPTPSPLSMDLLMPLSLNSPLTLTPNTNLGWLHPGTDFVWLSWSGSTAYDQLLASLAIPGNAATYVNPSDSADHDIAVGKSVMGITGVTGDAQLTSRLSALTGQNIVAPIFDQVNGNLFHISGYGLVQVTNYNAHNEKLLIHFVGLCDVAGNLL